MMIMAKVWKGNACGFGSCTTVVHPQTLILIEQIPQESKIIF